MKNRLYFAFAAGLIFTAPDVLTAADVVPPPVQRKAVLALVQTLLPLKSATPLPSVLKDPFNPPGFKPGETDPTVASGVVGLDPVSPGSLVVVPRVVPDRELLETLANLITPSGTVVLNGEPLLVFGGQTRRHVGETIFGTYAKDGKTYELTITAIRSDSFTLRFHSEELTRPILKRK
jgi:hypothetical protein